MDALRELLEGCPKPAALNLANNDIESLDGLEMLEEQLQDLALLDLSHNHLTCLEHIASLTQLARLNVAHNQISRIAHDCTSLTSLRSLDISHNQLGIGDWVHVLAQLPRLRDLKLIGNPIQDLHNYQGLITTFIPQLISLDGVAINPTDQQSDSSLSSTISLPSPRHLTHPPTFQQPLNHQLSAQHTSMSPELLDDVGQDQIQGVDTKHLGQPDSRTKGGAKLILAQAGAAGSTVDAGVQYDPRVNQHAVTARDAHVQAEVAVCEVGVQAAASQPAVNVHTQAGAGTHVLDAATETPRLPAHADAATETPRHHHASLQHQAAGTSPPSSSPRQHSALSAGPTQGTSAVVRQPVFGTEADDALKTLILSMRQEMREMQQEKGALVGYLQQCVAKIDAVDACMSPLSAGTEHTCSDVPTSCSSRPGTWEGTAVHQHSPPGTTGQHRHSLVSPDTGNTSLGVGPHRARQDVQGAASKVLSPAGAGQEAGQAQQLRQLQARCAALERICGIQEQQLVQQQQQGAAAGGAGAGMVHGLYAALQEQEAQLLKAEADCCKAQQELASQRAAWCQHSVDMQQQFESTQALVQVLEQRSSLHQSQMQAAAQQLHQVQADNTQLKDQLAKYEAAYKMVVNQVASFQPEFEQRVHQVELAASKVEGLAARLQFAKSRLQFSVELSRQAAAVPPVHPCTGAAPGRQPTPGSVPAAGGGGGNAELVSVLQAEIKRLVSDRDSLLLQLRQALESVQDRVGHAVARAQAEQQEKVDRLVEEQLQERLQHMQTQRDLCNVDASAEIAAAKSLVAQQAAALCSLVDEVESRSEAAMAGVMQRVQNLQTQVRQLAEAALHTRQAIARAKQESEVQEAALQEVRQQLADAQAQLAASKAESVQQLDEQHRQSNKELAEQQRRMTDAEHQAAKAMVLAKSLERQLSRLKEQRSQHENVMVAELQHKLDSREGALQAVRRERNALLAVLRQQQQRLTSVNLAQPSEPDGNEQHSVTARATAEVGGDTGNLGVARGSDWTGAIQQQHSKKHLTAPWDTQGSNGKSIPGDILIVHHPKVEQFGSSSSSDDENGRAERLSWRQSGAGQVVVKEPALRHAGLKYRQVLSSSDDSSEEGHPSSGLLPG